MPISYLDSIERIHPPSIFPISCNFSSKTIYFLTFNDFVSFDKRISAFKIKIFSSTFFSSSNFLSLDEYALFKLMVSDFIIKSLIFNPKEYFSDLGNDFKYSLNNLYNSIIL